MWLCAFAIGSLYGKHSKVIHVDVIIYNYFIFDCFVCLKVFLMMYIENKKKQHKVVCVCQALQFSVDIHVFYTFTSLLIALQDAVIGGQLF